MAKQGKAPSAPKKKKEEFAAGGRPPVANIKLKKSYQEEIVPALKKEFNYTNPMRIPRLVKVVVNMGVGEAIANPKSLEGAVSDMRAITGSQVYL